MSDLFFAPSKPAWIKRFRKPAVCNKNPRFLCLHCAVRFLWFPILRMNEYPKVPDLPFRLPAFIKIIAVFRASLRIWDSVRSAAAESQRAQAPANL